MSTPLAHRAFKVTRHPSSGTLDLYLVKNGNDLGPVEIAAKEASQIAAVVLGNATACRDESGRPPPEGKNLTLAVTPPSGFGVGQGRKSESSILYFQFGEASLGFEFPNTELRTFAQQLLTLVADESSRQ